MNFGQANKIIVSQFGKYFGSLYANARREGDVLVCGDIWGAPGKSFKITDRGAYAGQWRDFNGGDHGDFVELLRRVRGLKRPRDVLDMLVKDGFEHFEPLQVMPPKTKKDKDEERIVYAQNLYGRFDPQVGMYYRTEYLKTRGFKDHQARSMTHWVVGVRGAAGIATKHKQLPVADRPRKTIVHKVINAGSGKWTGIHRIHLDQRHRKYDGDSPRTMLGIIKGGVVPAFTHKIGDAMFLSEGVETAMAVAVLSRYKGSSLACLSCGNMVDVAKVISIRDTVKYLHVCMDDDDAGRESGELAGQIIKERYPKLIVSGLLPMGGYNDFNDRLQHERIE